MINLKKWQLAKHIINAKKNIDSIWFINRHQNELLNIDWKKRVEELFRSFYINCCNVLDGCFHNKKEICQNKTIDRIYYERDKMAAHDDENYIPQNISSLSELLKIMKEHLYTVKIKCSKYLPENLTLDYVPHDSELFRLIYRINADIEKDVEIIKFPKGTFHSYQLSDEGKHYFKNHDTSQQDRENARMFGYNYDEMIKEIEKQKNKPCILTDDERKFEEKRKAMINQMRINSYEAIQNIQDKCIRDNIINCTDEWYNVNYTELKRIENLHAQGVLDQFEIPNMKKLFNIQTTFGLI